MDEEKIDEEAVIEAAKKAQIYDFIPSDPEVLVLDEATSALDNETETAVMESIEQLRGMKTMIIIAHRLTTIKNVDRIYEVTDGKVETRSKEQVFGDNL